LQRRSESNIDLLSEGSSKMTGGWIWICNLLITKQAGVLTSRPPSLDTLCWPYQELTNNSSRITLVIYTGIHSIASEPLKIFRGTFVLDSVNSAWFPMLYFSRCIILTSPALHIQMIIQYPISCLLLLLLVVWKQQQETGWHQR